MITYKDKYLQKEKYGGASSAQLGATVILRNMVKELIPELEKNKIKKIRLNIISY
jgi:hypothetical protein